MENGFYRVFRARPRWASLYRVCAHRPAWFVFCIIAVSSLHGPRVVNAIENGASVPEQAAIVERLDSQVDLNLTLTDSAGNEKKLKDLLSSGKPLVLLPVYFGCPRLCSATQEGVKNMLNQLDLKLGVDFNVASISFDSRDTPERAAQFASRYRSELNAGVGDKTAWQFLVGSDQNVRSLMSAIGFSYEPDQGEFIHSAVAVILTPAGKIARYFYGIQFAAEAVRYALVEASHGNIGTTIDKIFLYCFRFDPVKGKYTLAVWNLTRFVSIAFCICLFALLLWLRAKEHRSSSC